MLSGFRDFIRVCENDTNVCNVWLCLIVNCTNKSSVNSPHRLVKSAWYKHGNKINNVMKY